MSSRRAGAPHHAPPPFQYSLCNEPLIELSNPGASGSLFYVTSDDEFIIKTVMHKEAEFLQKLLPGYYMVGAGAGPWEALGGPVHRPQPHAAVPLCPQLLSADVQEQGLQGPVDEVPGPWGTTHPLGHETPSRMPEPHPGGPFRGSPILVNGH